MSPSPAGSADTPPGGDAAPTGGVVERTSDPGATATPLFAIKVAKASRVVIPDYGIDLPIVSSDLQPPPDNYPLCDVAQYLTTFDQPGKPGVAYVYAHARDGMFLPLLQASERADGAELAGKRADVYTSDGRIHHYEMYQVQRHALDYDLAKGVKPGEQRLLLQTSEGPYGTVPKLVIAARHLGSEEGDVAAANPEARPRDCRPTEEQTPEPTARPTPAGPVASRVVIERYGIDLPIVSGDLEVAGNPTGYPLCDVAQYLTRYGQPGELGASYIYAHAREGMFLPLLAESERDEGKGLIGVEVRVHTTDGRVHTYKIDRVVPHATDTFVADHVPSDKEALILQTSEGPKGTVPKLVIRAPLVDAVDGDPAEATPPASPRVCA